MIANMACSLIEHKRIHTTVAKAKALKGFIEPLLTKSKTDSTQSRRVVFGYLQNKEAVTELFREIAPKVAERNGGYTRIIKTGPRQGDAAEMCFIELVDFNELMLREAGAKKTTRRSRRSGGAKKTEGKAAAPAAAAPEAQAPVAEVEAPVAEEVVETSAETAEETAPEAAAPEASAEENTESTEGEEKPAE
jgi:large subunit ribosomal protein L17